MKKIFPSEMINHSAEVHFHKHSRPFRWIYVSMVIFLIAAIAILPLIKVQISTQSRGVIRTPVESINVQNVLGGQVTGSHLKEGQRVLAGDTLIILDDSQLKEQISLAWHELNENRVFINDLGILLGEGKAVESSSFQIELSQYMAKIKEMQIEVDILAKEFDIADQLYKERVIASIEYLQTKKKYDAVMSNMEVYKKQVRNSWQSEITKLELKCVQLQSSISRLESECQQYVITSPIAGSLSRVAGIQKGSFVTPGQVLAVISPQGALIAECYVSPLDIGFIHDQQEVRLQLDAFDYNQWGLIQGTVSSISDDVMLLNDNPVFRVRCHLPVHFLQLKTGQRGYLKKGMTLTGRFVLTERTLYQLLFDKVDDWINPKLEAEGLIANN